MPFQHLSHTLTLTCPDSCDPERWEARLADEFGGCTAVHATGSWRNVETGEMIREPVTLLTVYYENTGKAVRRAEDVTADFQRVLTVDNGESAVLHTQSTEVFATIYSVT